LEPTLDGKARLEVGDPRIYAINRAAAGVCTEFVAGLKEINDQSVVEFGFLEERRSCNVGQRAWVGDVFYS